MPQEYLPESWSMRKDSIYAAQEAIRAGIENTQELLIEHDASLGRTTRKNRCIAERLEAEIRQMQAALNGLQTPNGCPYGENSSIATESAIDDKPPRNEA
jgi:D-serine deaminase-like pyridoxal phosphate-dependent protein